MEFCHTEFVPAIGMVGGFVIGWTTNVNLKVVIENTSLINILVFSHLSHTLATNLCVWTDYIINETSVLGVSTLN